MNQVKWQVDDEVRRQARRQITDQGSRQVMWQVDDELRWQVSRQVWEQVGRHQIRMGLQ